MLAFLGLLTGLAGPIRDITREITSLQQARLKAETDVEKAGITREIESAHDRKAVLVAEAGSRLNAIVRAVAAVGPISYVLKIFLFDKVIGSFVGHTANIFRTDPLTTEQAAVLAAVIGFYFLYDMTKKR
jgi:hypothetical protein